MERKIDYQAHLQSLFSGTLLPTNVNGQAKAAILETLELMLKEKDPRFARDIGDEFVGTFKGYSCHIAAQIVQLVRSSGNDRGIKTISFLDALSRVYSGEIQAVRRLDKGKSTKRFKNSQLIYASESSLDKYIRDNSKTKLFVYF